MISKAKFSLPVLAAVVALALAAAIFVANLQPFGYIAPPALSTQSFLHGSAIAYTPWFENGTFQGDLLALPVASNGSVAIISPVWRAAEQLDGQNPTTGRRIVTTNGSGTATAFTWAALTASQQGQLGAAAASQQAMLNFIRGVRTGEGTTYRLRTGVLGDIIHSNPVYVAKPAAGYTFDNYLAYVAANVNRAPRVAVGANDGMLHVFDASTGDEVFAYIPSTVVPNLSKLATTPYVHTYFVDGPLTAGDARFDSNWHTVLVGGLAAGGQGYFALNLTDAAVASEALTTNKVLWEFHAGGAGATNLGYGYSRPSIVQLNNGQWAALLANGYLSATGKASLYLLDIKTGAVIRELIVSDAAANGLSSPTAIDTNGDFKVDVAYAGDLNGNVWKFDLSSASAASWQVANTGKPLFQTALTGAVRQAITTAPEVGRHPKGGYLVFVGTGRLLDGVSDAADKTPQAVYGLWDNNWPAALLPISPDDLLSQQLYSGTHTATGKPVRTASAGAINWEVHRGWKMSMEIVGASSQDQGERVLQDLTLRDNRIHVMSVNPSISTGDNWYLQLDAFTGGAPPKTIIDINRDSFLNVADNVDGNGDLQVTDTARDRLVGEFQSFGLASRPVIGVVGAAADAALINHLRAISPSETKVPNDPGLLGGHIDLDTSHLIYDPNNGSTDGHVHEWDDKNDLTTIDFLNLPDGKGNPLYEISSETNGVHSNRPFILTIANADLSPGGVLEINGTSADVKDYQALVKRFLSKTMLAGESFPVYKMTPPTTAEKAAGWKQLTSLKLSWDAYAIVNGDIIPTVTGCVRGNDSGALGEYRNGALLLQALDASVMTGGYKLVNGSGLSTGVNAKRYESSTTLGAGSNFVNYTLGSAMKGLFWESTVFWHWKGPCYGAANYAAEFKSCLIDHTTSCYDSALPVTDETIDKGKKKKKKKKKGEVDPPGGGGEPPAEPIDPQHGVTDTTIGGNNKTGRLFWKEMVPVE
jgi:hypothetical protein